MSKSNATCGKCSNCPCSGRGGNQPQQTTCTQQVQPPASCACTPPQQTPPPEPQQSSGYACARPVEPPPKYPPGARCTCGSAKVQCKCGMGGAPQTAQPPPPQYQQVDCATGQPIGQPQQHQDAEGSSGACPHCSGRGDRQGRRSGKKGCCTII